VDRSRAFDALGFAFDVEADDRTFLSYVSTLLAAFEPPDRAAHHYALRASPDSDRESQELLLDGQRLATAPAAGCLIEPLIRDLNQQVVNGCGLLALHAGAVEYDGLGLVLPAEMEAGKTTLVAGLVRAGFAYLSDEAATLDPDTGWVQPYPKPLSIDQGSWALFPELEPDAELPTDDYKNHQWQVPPDAIRAHALGRSCPIGTIAFPSYTKGAETALEPLSRAEALVELAKNTFRFKDQARTALDQLARIVRDAVCYRLTIGDLNMAVDLAWTLTTTTTDGRRAS
jgi:hypothetical protein